MIPVNILAVQYLTGASGTLCDGLELPPGYHSLGLLTTDCDDATYIALDEATKAADVLVCYGRSFYGGAANASTPYAGEVIGILAGKTPGAVRSGMEAAIKLLGQIGFELAGEVPYLAYAVNRSGSFLAQEAGVPEGTPLAYLIAPPLESICGLDAAIKASNVKLCKLYTPPSQTNFGGGLLCGTPSACQAACAAFAQAVAEIAKNPKG
ncbi:MAG: ethanolamine utilization microcompartment protein EutL [Oscillospiraceae bacterium]|nr:ethanolamine utilization microcompartment protein EutL [Oscillospiraceae bacterium]